MSPEAWLVALVVLSILVGLAAEIAPASVLVFGGVVILLLVGVLDAGSALSGFSNPAPFTVGALLIVARGISKTGAIRPFTQRLLGESGHTRRPLLRMLLPATVASGFMNNIPLVAMMIPEISSWARKRGSNVSKFLLPLSYAAILGGLLTIIGTSTNLVVAGQMTDFGLDPFSFFELGQIGLPIAVLGIITLVVVSPLVLRSSSASTPGTKASPREYSIEVEVIQGGPLDGLTVEDAGLRHLEGVFLVSVDQGDMIIAPARPDTVLHGGDVLRFVGKVDEVLDLQSIKGLRHPEQVKVRAMISGGPTYFTTAIGADSPLIGRTLKQIGFRSRYQAAVVAIHRAGERVEAKLGEVSLRVGDSLIVVSDPAFKDRWQSHSDFLLITDLDDELRPPAKGSGRTLLIVTAMIALAATGLMPILHASLGGAVALVAVGVLAPHEARRALDLDVLGLIAAAFGLAAAVDVSGLGTVVADGLIGAFGTWGERGVILGVVLATIAITELITNNAAALLLFPIALSASEAAGVDPRGMAVAVALAASAAFLTPIGYQTNTMVWGPGGYRLSDFLKAGLPLTAVTVAVIATMVPIIY